GTGLPRLASAIFRRRSGSRAFVQAFARAAVMAGFHAYLPLHPRVPSVFPRSLRRLRPRPTVLVPAPPPHPAPPPESPPPAPTSSPQRTMACEPLGILLPLGHGMRAFVRPTSSTSPRSSQKATSPYRTSGVR